MTVLLYHYPKSTCSAKVRLMLAEKGVAYESQIVDLTKGEQLSASYLEINPNGVVPTLVHDGRAVRDSSVICEYIDEVFEGPKLTPETAVNRAAMRTWMRYLEEVPTVANRVLSFKKVFMRRLAALQIENYSAMAMKMPIRKHFMLAMRTDNPNHQSERDALEQMALCLSRIERAIKAEGPYLLGQDLSIADIVILPILVRLSDLELSEMWDNLPGVSKFLETLSARPSFAAAYFDGTRIALPKA